MIRRDAERNLKLYYLFQLFKEPLFWGPILITFIINVSHMSLTEVYIMEAICIMGIILLDSPFGALADLIGRRYTILIGIIVWSVKLFTFASATNPSMIWLANIFWVIGASLINGADTSMLADTLKFLGRESEFQKIEGRSQAYRLGLIAVCSIAVGYLAEINLRLPIYLGIPFMLIACASAYLMTEPPFAENRSRTRAEYLNLLKLSALFVYNNVKVKWIIAFSALIAIISKLWFFTYNPYFELVELPLVYFGWIFCILNVIASICSHQSDRINKYLGDYGSVVMTIILMGLPIWLMGQFVGTWAILLVFSQNIVRGYVGPFLNSFLHSHLDSSNRATVYSLKSTVANLGEFVTLIIFGLALSSFGLATCLQILGLLTIILGLPLIVTFRKIFSRQ